MAKSDKDNRLQFHHVCIVVSDYQKAVEFYVECLGLEIHCETFSVNRNAVKMELYSHGTYIVEMFVAGSSKKEKQKEMVQCIGLEHLSFLTRDVGSMLEKVKNLGLPVSEVKVDGSTERKYGFCWDWDKNKIEFYER